MTYEVKKKADRLWDRQPAHAVENDRIDMTSLYANDDDLSSILSAPLTETHACKPLALAMGIKAICKNLHFVHQLDS